MRTQQYLQISNHCIWDEYLNIYIYIYDYCIWDEYLTISNIFTHIYTLYFSYFLFKTWGTLGDVNDEKKQPLSRAGPLALPDQKICWINSQIECQNICWVECQNMYIYMCVCQIEGWIQCQNANEYAR